MLHWRYRSLKRFLKKQGLANQVSYDGKMIRINVDLFNIVIREEKFTVPGQSSKLDRKYSYRVYSEIPGTKFTSKSYLYLDKKQINSTVLECLTDYCHHLLFEPLHYFTRVYQAQIRYCVVLHLLVIKIDNKLYYFSIRRGLPDHGYRIDIDRQPRISLNLTEGFKQGFERVLLTQKILSRPTSGAGS